MGDGFMSIWKEISNIQNPRRKAYFQWKNGIQNIKKDYSKMTEEEFLEYVDGGDEALRYLKRWESSPEYKRLLFLLKEDEFATDLLDVYEAVKEKAVEETDSQAIKNMIMLQKEIKKYRKDIDEYFEQEEKEEQEQDDGLII